MLNVSVLKNFDDTEFKKNVYRQSDIWLYFYKKKNYWKNIWISHKNHLIFWNNMKKTSHRIFVAILF